MRYIDICLCILGAWRVAHMLARETGPLALFERIRMRFDPEQATWLGQGLNCPLCIGFWASFVLALLLFDGTVTTLIVNWLAIAGGQAILQKILDRIVGE